MTKSFTTTHHVSQPTNPNTAKPATTTQTQPTLQDLIAAFLGDPDNADYIYHAPPNARGRRDKMPATYDPPTTTSSHLKHNPHTRNRWAQE